MTKQNGKFRALNRLRDMKNRQQPLSDAEAIAESKVAYNPAMSAEQEDWQTFSCLTPEQETLFEALIEVVQSLDTTMTNFKLPKVELDDEHVSLKVDIEQLKPYFKTAIEDVLEKRQKKREEEDKEKYSMTLEDFCRKTAMDSERIAKAIDHNVQVIVKACCNTSNDVSKVLKVRLEKEVGVKPVIEEHPTFLQSVAFYLWKLPCYKTKLFLNGRAVRLFMWLVMLAMWIISIGFISFIAYDKVQLQPYKDKYLILREFSRKQDVTSDDFDRIDMYFSDPKYHDKDIRDWCKERTVSSANEHMSNRKIKN